MKSVIETMEQLVRQGRFDSVENQLYKLGKVPRVHAAAIAKIARRINRPNISVRILQPIVRPESKFESPATAQEKIEYAEALRRVGAVSEAWQLLCEVDDVSFPEVLIHKTYCLFNQWKYTEAVPLLRKYLDLETVAPYDRAVGEINMVAALISVGNHSEASKNLDRLRVEFKQAGLKLLYGNSLELSAQVLIQEKKYSSALEFLSEAQEVLKDSGFMVSLFVRKWRAICESLQRGEVTQDLCSVVETAQRELHWETVRDCLLYIAAIQNEGQSFDRLFCGTPFESFRERVAGFSRADYQPPERYLWSVTNDPNSILDLETGLVTGQHNAQLPVGQSLHRFLIILARDFYRPTPVMSAFSQLFPGEYMASTSANRVHQIISRLREWIQESGIELQLEEINGSYRLVFDKTMGILVPSKPLSLDTSELEWMYFKKQVARTQFGITDAVENVQWSRTSTRRVLQWAVEQGHIEKIGKGSKTQYRLLEGRPENKVA